MTLPDDYFFAHRVAFAVPAAAMGAAGLYLAFRRGLRRPARVAGAVFVLAGLVYAGAAGLCRSVEVVPRLVPRYLSMAQAEALFAAAPYAADLAAQAPWVAAAWAVLAGGRPDGEGD